MNPLRIGPEKKISIEDYMNLLYKFNFYLSGLIFRIRLTKLANRVKIAKQQYLDRYQR